jgi:hypothetical protein
MTHSQHNYVKKILLLIEAGLLPIEVGLQEIDIRHDDWCGIFQGKRCACDPDITRRPTAAHASHN